MTRILIAEDDENDFFLLELAFKRNGAPVSLQRVKDGQEAIDFLARLVTQEDAGRGTLPEIVLTDLHMPRADGFEVIRWVRSHLELKRMVVAVLSSSAQPEDISLAYDLGANSYLTKPSTLEELTARIALMFQFWAKCSQRPQWFSQARCRLVSAN